MQCGLSRVDIDCNHDFAIFMTLILITLQAKNTVMEALKENTAIATTASASMVMDPQAMGIVIENQSSHLAGRGGFGC